MFKRSGANLSLWPEHRPGRGRPLKFAVGSFVLGAVCATAYGALFNFADPATGQGLSVQRVVEPIPIVVERQPQGEAAVPVPPPRPVETERRPGRARTATAKGMLPLIGAPSPRPSAATEGRGDDGLAGEVRLIEPESDADNVPNLLGDENERTVPKTPGKKAGAAPTDGAPMPRVAPPQTAAVNDAEPPTSEATAKNEPAGQPKVEKAATENAARALTSDSRTEGGAVVLAKREEAMTLVGDDDVRARTPSAQAATSKAVEPMANTEAPSERRRGVVRKKKDERPARLSRADDAPARGRVARTSKSKKAEMAAAREPRAGPRKRIARTKSEKPARYAARTHSKHKKPARRMAGRRHDRLSSMIAQANSAFRAVTAGGGFTQPTGF